MIAHLIRGIIWTDWKTYQIRVIGNRIELFNRANPTDISVTAVVPLLITLCSEQSWLTDVFHRTRPDRNESPKPTILGLMWADTPTARDWYNGNVQTKLGGAIASLTLGWPIQETINGHRRYLVCNQRPRLHSERRKYYNECVYVSTHTHAHSKTIARESTSARTHIRVRVQRMGDASS